MGTSDLVKASKHPWKAFASRLGSGVLNSSLWLVVEDTLWPDNPV